MMLNKEPYQKKEVFASLTNSSTLMDNNKNFKKSYAMLNQINTVYYNLPPSYLLKLGKKYKANYIVHQKNLNLNLPIVFSTKKVLLYLN